MYQYNYQHWTTYLLLEQSFGWNERFVANELKTIVSQHEKKLMIKYHFELFSIFTKRVSKRGFLKACIKYSKIILYSLLLLN